MVMKRPVDRPTPPCSPFRRSRFLTADRAASPAQGNGAVRNGLPAEAKANRHRHREPSLPAAAPSPRTPPRCELLGGVGTRPSYRAACLRTLQGERYQSLARPAMDHYLAHNAVARGATPNHNPTCRAGGGRQSVGRGTQQRAAGQERQTEQDTAGGGRSGTQMPAWVLCVGRCTDF